ncbi:MAG: septum formation protein Maf [Pseudobutyrivibrio sp.]|nr:septum formation protein Maf [Pseudobutyrivibrio sp.]
MKIILASNSPRRKELLERIGYEYTVKPTEIDESTSIIDPELMVKDLSYKKAMAVVELEKGKLESDDCVVLGSDTVVSIDGCILGKPIDEEDAFEMLKRLSGKSHIVCTGVSLIPLWDIKKAVTFSETAKVYFCKLTDDEIWKYIMSREPMDKAGGYGIQGLASKFIEKIEGDYYTIMGLPVCRTYKELKKLAE